MCACVSVYVCMHVFMCVQECINVCKHSARSTAQRSEVEPSAQVRNVHTPHRAVVAQVLLLAFRSVRHVISALLVCGQRGSSLRWSYYFCLCCLECHSTSATYRHIIILTRTRTKQNKETNHRGFACCDATRLDLTHQHSTTDVHSPLPLSHFTHLRLSVY